MLRRTLLRRALATSALTLAPAGLAHALCASRQHVFALHGAITATRPCTAGLVLVSQDAPSRVAARDVAAVRLVGPGQTPYSFTIEEVTPDVLALRPATTLAPGRYELRGISSDPMPLELVEAPIAAPPPPAVVAIRRSRSTAHGGVRGIDSSALTLELRSGAPTGAIAIAEWTQGGETARTWGVIGSTAPRPTAILASSGHCAGHGRFPPEGARLTIRVLDLYAQLSPPSRVLRAPR